MAPKFTDRDVTKYLLSSGIPKPFLKSSLREYGPTGERYAASIQDYENINSFNDLSVFNFYGRGLQQEGFLISVLRAYLLVGKSGKLLSLPDIIERSYNELLELENLFVLGVQNFYNPEIKSLPYPGKEMYQLESFILRYILGGGVILLGSNAPINQFAWYSDSFVQAVSSKSREEKIECRKV